MTAIIPRYPDLRTAPLRSVVDRTYTDPAGGVTLGLECGHEVVKPRRDINFTTERVRCPACGGITSLPASQDLSVACPACDGTGTEYGPGDVLPGLCSFCFGRRRVTKHEAAEWFAGCEEPE